MRKGLGFVVGVLLLARSAASAAQARPIARPDSDGPDGPPVLAEKGHGAETVDRLGPNADAVAARLRLSAKELRQRMTDDDSLWLDQTGHAFYVEPVAPTPIALPAGGPQAAAQFPYSQTFTLHSRPGSNRVLYLDFDGQTVAGTGWNAAGLVQTAVPPFDADGNPAVFGLAEQDLIQGVWQRVSDDYAPFDVDVTTQDPGTAALTQTNAADLTFGMRALITSSPTVMTQTCGIPCGGIAYVGGFGAAYYMPAFIFADALSNNEKWIALQLGSRYLVDVGRNGFGVSGVVEHVVTREPRTDNDQPSRSQLHGHVDLSAGT